ncbi:F0F1 ATP synthase subunit delta [Candidatus Saccharibacteria bacterium]|nr:F0F1 ATP synthase subunit delta [Candidatus Saccharibacteria bacterium]
MTAKPAGLRLPDSVSSLQDLATLQLEVRAYARWLSHEAVKIKVHAKNISEPPPLSPAANQLIHDYTAGKPATPAGLDELVQQLEDRKKKAPTLTITLAGPPTRGLKGTLVGWCRENIAPDVLVNFQFNASILGGLVVRSGSHTFDWSFRRQILDNRAKFPEVLRHVR